MTEQSPLLMEHSHIKVKKLLHIILDCGVIPPPHPTSPSPNSPTFLGRKTLSTPANVNKSRLESGVVCDSYNPSHHHGQKSSQFVEDKRQREKVTL